MGIKVAGAEMGAQHIGGDSNNNNWRVSYQRDGGGLYLHNVNSRNAQSPEDAMQIAKRELGQQD